jgi:hypothetical protein
LKKASEMDSIIMYRVSEAQTHITLNSYFFQKQSQKSEENTAHL